MFGEIGGDLGTRGEDRGGCRARLGMEPSICAVIIAAYCLESRVSSGTSKESGSLTNMSVALSAKAKAWRMRAKLSAFSEKCGLALRSQGSMMLRIMPISAPAVDGGGALTMS